MDLTFLDQVKEETEERPSKRVKSESPEESPDDNRNRFLMELEFVQCLANPHYLNFLAQSRYFQDKAFIAYLKYLLYWKQPQYSKFLVYPQCLKFLELLQEENFRNALINTKNTDIINEQQFYQWKYYRNNRLYPKND